MHMSKHHVKAQLHTWQSTTTHMANLNNAHVIVQKTDSTAQPRNLTTHIHTTHVATQYNYHSAIMHMLLLNCINVTAHLGPCHPTITHMLLR